MLPPSGMATFPLSALSESCVRGGMDGLGPLIAVEVGPDGVPYTVQRARARVYVNGGADAVIDLGVNDSAVVTGHEVFHANTRSGVACASCHPEGGDDGHVWNFEPTGERRTQSLGGGLLATAPFHWNGDLSNMDDLMSQTFRQRMAGFMYLGDAAAVGDWLDTLPTPVATVTDEDAVARGRALFESAEVGCASCHSGDALTNDANADIGLGGAFQVPSLRGVVFRPPYFHDGCASTLEDVVNGACGTLDHMGHTSQLSAAEHDDLVAYLRSL